MSSRLSGFVSGVLIEILWDVERVNAEGRRSGESVTESIWWKGEVVEVNQKGEQMLAKIHYDAMGGFRAQLGEVRVLPMHVQVVDDNMRSEDQIQLPWRYYLSSGPVSYNFDVTESVSQEPLTGITCHSSVEQESRLLELNQKLEQLEGKFERLERIMVSQRDICGVIASRMTKQDGDCERIFGLLREKLAAKFQGSLPSYRQKNAYDTSTQFDYSCAGTIRADVDCTVEEFETICSIVTTRCGDAFFCRDGRGFVLSEGCLRASDAAVDIMFTSLANLLAAIGLDNYDDMMKIVKRERKPRRKGQAEDAALRVCASYLVNFKEEGTPSAILVCQGVHEGRMGSEKVDAITRVNDELDPKTVWYRHPLQRCEISLLSLAHYVFQTNQEGETKDNWKELVASHRTDVSCFSLRWKALAKPNPKLWSRKLLRYSTVSGILEAHIPYVLIRGSHGVHEIGKLLSDGYIDKLLKVGNAA